MGTYASLPTRPVRFVLTLVCLVLLTASCGFAGIREKAPEPTPAGKGLVVPLGRTLTINLADGHYLKLGMALQMAAGQPEQLDTSPAISLAIDKYTGRSIGELSTEKGRESLKQELIEATSEAYKGAVTDIYFTDFVTQ